MRLKHDLKVIVCALPSASNLHHLFDGICVCCRDVQEAGKIHFGSDPVIWRLLHVLHRHQRAQHC